MLKQFCLAFVLGILISGLDLGLVKSTGLTRHDNSLVRVKRNLGGQITDKHRDTVFTILINGILCTGTFIAPNLVLTAAICCKNYAASSPISIYNLERTIDRTISSVHINPINSAGNYANPAKNFAKNGIAVIQLDSKVDSIRVASLGYDYAISCNETVYQYSFGIRDPVKHPMSDQLKVCTARVAKCSWFTYYKHYIPFMHFNDPLQTKVIDSYSCNSWYADQGGPLFTKDDLLIGVESHLRNRIMKRGYFARISKHKKFLQTALTSLASKEHSLNGRASPPPLPIPEYLFIFITISSLFINISYI